jgi:hypothetical protein
MGIMGTMSIDKKFVVRHGIKTDNVEFKTGQSNLPLAGELTWNNTNGTLNLGLDGDNVILQIGKETYYKVTNNTESSIQKGTLVMTSGTNGGQINIVPAVSNGTASSNRIIGITAEDIDADSDGYVLNFGQIGDLDTSDWSSGDTLYADPAVAGGLTNILPVAPNLKIVVGIVLTSNATTGMISVRLNYGSNLAKDDLVELTNLEDGDLIIYNGSSGRFQNIAQESIGFIGSQGDIGFTGSQGDIGYTGSQGDIGFTGSQGDIGYTGSQGDIGYTGSQGDIGYTGSQGDIGYTGSQGDIGFTGSKGFTGSQGIQGDIGFTGSKGDIGFTGSQGIQGDIGFTGSQGIQGDIGFTGSQGIQGDIGFTGSKGDIGFTGSQGIQGDIGFTGSQGIQGDIGFTGSQGIQGDIGFTGSKGDIGFTGSQGIQGDIGFTGSQGIQGDIGFTGSQGIQGDIGFTGSKGLTGSKGFTGSQGIQGDIGFTGSQGIQGDIGFTGSKGLTGSKGFTGSQGIQGDIGFTGSQGIQGDIGFTGSKGLTGSKGFTGSQGIQGDIGFTGSKGVIGFTGSQGIQGVIGFTGSRGVIGFTGSQGIQGVIGFTGSKGTDGTIGADGKDYNISEVNNVVGYEVTSTLANGFAAPSTSGLRYLVKSIHVTNFSAFDGWVTADLSMSGGPQIEIINEIPLPSGSSVELIKRPKVMYPSDALRFRANANTRMHTTISYMIYDNTNFVRNGVDLTASTITDVFTSASTNGTVIDSVLVANDAGMDEIITVIWANGSNTLQGYYAANMVIPANGSVELLEGPKFLANGFKIRATAGSANKLEILVSGYDRD